MFGTQDLTLFIISGLLLNIAPGPDSILVMTRSATQGWRAGLAAALAASSWAFTAVKWVGAAYLIYIGLKLALAERP